MSEIERLRATIDRASAAWLKLEPGIAWEGGLDGAMVAAVGKIERLQRDVDGLTTALAGSGKTVIIESATQAKRIAELEESLQRERAMAFSKIQRQRHAIANLCRAKRERGKALVEERARFNSIIGAIPANQCKFPEQDLSKAREQLRVEGKI